MSIQKLERVLWRLRKETTNTNYYTHRQLERAIMKECGTSLRTIQDNRKALSRLGWIKVRRGGKRIELTGEDLI